MDTVPAGDSLSSLAISPAYATDHTLFAGTQTGVYRSTSGGASWTEVKTGPDVQCVAVSPAYASDHTVFAGGTWFGPSCTLKSTSGGNTWTKINTGLPAQDANITSLAVSPAYTTDHTVFAGTNEGVYESTSGGASWSAMNTGLTNVGVNSVAVSPAYATDHTLFAGSDTVYSYTVPTPTLTASGSGTIAYGASEPVTATLLDEASAPIPDCTLTLQSATSATATSWANVAAATTDTNGVHEFDVSPTHTTYYRVRFAGDTSYANALSSVVSVAVQVYLSTPSCSATVHVNKPTTFAGYLKPHHAAGAKSVKLQFYHSVTGNWVYVKTVAATNADHSTYTRYAASTALSSKGSWQVRAYHPADATNAATYSAWKTFTVN